MWPPIFFIICSTAPPNPNHHRLFVLVLIALVISIKVGGMDIFVKFSTVLVMVTMLPILFYFGFGITKLTWSDIDTFSGDYACNVTSLLNASKHAETCSHEVALHLPSKINYTSNPGPKPLTTTPNLNA